MEERRYRRLGCHHHISQWRYPCQRFVNCGGKDTRQCPRSTTSEETKSWAKAESNRDPFSYQPSGLALSQTSSPGRGRPSDWGRNTAHSIQRTYVTKVDERLHGMVTDIYFLMYAARRGYCALNKITNYLCNPSDSSPSLSFSSVASFLMSAITAGVSSSHPDDSVLFCVQLFCPLPNLWKLSWQNLSILSTSFLSLAESLPHVVLLGNKFR